MTPGTLAAGLFLLGALTFLYLRAVRRHYRLRSERPVRLLATCEDGGRLAVFHRPARHRRWREPVLLCHGLATQHLNMDFDPPYSLAHAFAEAGFEVFSVDWRGSGESRPPPGRGRFDYDVDDLIESDAPALIALARARSGAEEVFWVGHSLGGLVGCGVLGGPDRGAIRGLCTLGTPVYFRYARWLTRVISITRLLAWPTALRQRWTSIALAPWLGHVTLPLTDVLVNPKAIAPPLLRKVYANLIDAIGYRLLGQFGEWIREDRFRSRDGRRDYRAALRETQVPVLVIGGSQDGIAPAESVTAQHLLYGSADKTLMIFGRENGDRLDYGHGDLIFGERAPEEVYPPLVRWVEARATPLG